MKRQRRRAGERGSNVIEAALTLPLFLLFVFSIVDFGWTLFLHQTLLNQASAGARYGAALRRLLHLYRTGSVRAASPSRLQD